MHIWIYSTCIAYVYLIFTLPIQWLSFHIYHHQTFLICSVTLKNCKNKGGLCRLQPFIVIEKLRFNLKIVFFKIMPETLFKSFVNSYIVNGIQNRSYNHLRSFKLYCILVIKVAVIAHVFARASKIQCICTF